MKTLQYFCFILVFPVLLAVSCSHPKMTVKEVMDNTITKLYQTKNYLQLSKLDNDQVMALFSKDEKEALATQHWSFDVNEPVMVSVMRSSNQKIVPFWLTEKGFHKTDLTMKNEQTVYEVWQKSFDAGHVGLGVDGFEQNLGMHYFVSVAPLNN